MLSKLIRRLLNFLHNKKWLFQKETAVKFVKKPNLLFCGDKPHFCFSADMCGRKTQHQTKTAEHAVFKARGWYWREWSAVRKLYDFRRTAFPPKEGRFIDTLNGCFKKKQPLRQIQSLTYIQFTFYKCANLIRLDAQHHRKLIVY